MEIYAGQIKTLSLLPWLISFFWESNKFIYIYESLLKSWTTFNEYIYIDFFTAFGFLGLTLGFPRESGTRCFEPLITRTQPLIISGDLLFPSQKAHYPSIFLTSRLFFWKYAAPFKVLTAEHRLAKRILNPRALRSDEGLTLEELFDLFNSSRWPIYIFNLVDITKLPCYPDAAPQFL